MVRGGKKPRSGPSIFDENLLASSQVRLFGRIFHGLKLDPEGLATLSHDGPSPNRNPLTDKLNPKIDPRLARIYGFSYEGSYFKLDAPYVFLVHGEGTPIEEPTSVADVGVEMKDEEFLRGVRMWSYDKVDFSVRIQVVSGWIEEILLDAAMGSATNMTAGELAPRVDLTGRVDMQSRVDLTSRVDLAMRSRLKGS